MADIARILRGCKAIAVVGYSHKPQRPSHWISNYLEEHGYRVHRVNPVLESTADCPIYPTLADVPEPVDIVDVFRAPPHVPAIVDAAIAIGAKVVWMQPGTENPAAAQSGTAAGLDAIVGNCIYREHKAVFHIEDDRGQH